MATFADRVQETTTTTGTGTLTLAGAVAGYRAFSVVGNGATVYYTITDTSNNWEVGQGTYTSSGTTLSRTTILASSNSNAAVSFAAGTKTVFLDLPASAVLPQGASVVLGNLANTITATSAGSGSYVNLAATGSDTNISLNIAAKGNAPLSLSSSGGIQLAANGTTIGFGGPIYTAYPIQFNNSINDDSGNFAYDGTTLAVNALTVNNGGVPTTPLLAVQTDVTPVLGGDLSLNNFSLKASTATTLKLANDGATATMQITDGGDINFVIPWTNQFDISDGFNHVKFQNGTVTMDGNLTVNGTLYTPSTDHILYTKLMAAGPSGLVLQDAGSGHFIALQTDGSGTQQVKILHTASATNYLTLTGGATGSPANVVIGADGASTHIDINITPKGNGVVKVGGVQVRTVSSTGTVSASTSATTITPGANEVVNVTLTASTTITMTTAGATDGQRVTLRLIQDATGGRTVAFNTTVGFGTDITSFTATTTASKTDIVGLQYNSAAGKWQFVAYARGY